MHFTCYNIRLNSNFWYLVTFMYAAVIMCLSIMLAVERTCLLSEVIAEMCVKVQGDEHVCKCL